MIKPKIRNTDFLLLCSLQDMTKIQKGSVHTFIVSLARGLLKSISSSNADRRRMFASSPKQIHFKVSVKEDIYFKYLFELTIRHDQLRYLRFI